MREAIAEHGSRRGSGSTRARSSSGGEGETLVTGDAVNVAARLEQAAAAGEVLIGAETRLLVRDAVRVEALEPLELKGKSAPVEAYRLLDVVARRGADRAQPRRAARRARAGAAAALARLRGCRRRPHVPAVHAPRPGRDREVAPRRGLPRRVGGAADVLRGRCLSYGEGITYWPLVEMLVPLGIEPERSSRRRPRRRGSHSGGCSRLVRPSGPRSSSSTTCSGRSPCSSTSSSTSPTSRATHRSSSSASRAPSCSTPGRTGAAGSSTRRRSCSSRSARTSATTLMDEPARRDRAGRGAPRAHRRARVGTRSTSRRWSRWLRERPGGAELAVPPTIHALLQARIDSLDGRACASSWSAERSRARSSTAARSPSSCPTSATGARRALSSLVRKELIRPEPSLLPGRGCVRFRHLLIRDAAYGAMPKELRAQLHERFADWLERSTATRASSSTRSSATTSSRRSCFRRGARRRATTSSRARAAVEAAGARARARWVAPTSRRRRLLQRGVDLLPADDPTRLEALSAISRRRSRGAASSSGPRRSCARAIEEARRAGERAVEAQARLDLNSPAHPGRPRRRSVEDELGEALEIAAALERTGELADLARAYTEIGMARFMLGRAGEGEADLERSAELARRAGDRLLERDALVARLRPVAWGPTPAEAGIAFCDVLLERRRRERREQGARAPGPCAAARRCSATSQASGAQLQTRGRSSRSSA